MKYWIIIFLSVLSKVACSQETHVMIEQQSFYSQSKEFQPIVWSWTNTYFDSTRFGIFSFALGGQKWGEVIAGPSYTIPYTRGSVEFGAGIGVEVDNVPVRGMAYMFLNHKLSENTSLNFLIDGEYGGSGYWYLWFLTWNFSRGVVFGVQGQGFVGPWGPRFGYRRGHIMVYAAGGYVVESSEMGGILGLRAIF